MFKVADCCKNNSCAIQARKVNQTKILKIVFLINLFLLGLTAYFSLAASSTRLLSESFDDLGDAITYAQSLYVVYKSNKNHQYQKVHHEYRAGYRISFFG